MRLLSTTAPINPQDWYAHGPDRTLTRPSKNRRTWAIGDVFKIGGPEGWGWGVIVRQNVGAFHGFLTYIYACTDGDATEIPAVDLRRLLIAPIVVAPETFTRGSAHYIGHHTFAPGELLERHFFRTLTPKTPFVDERQMPAFPKVGDIISANKMTFDQGLIKSIFDPRLRLDHPDLPPNTTPPPAPVFDRTSEPPEAPEPPGPISVTLHVPDLLSPLDRGEDLEDPLDEALRAAGVGLVSGGGSDMERGSEVHIELIDEARGLPALRAALGALTLPEGAWLTIAGRRLEIRE